MKKIVFLSLLLALIISISGCTKKEANKLVSFDALKDFAYDVNDFENLNTNLTLRDIETFIEGSSIMNECTYSTLGYYLNPDTSDFIIYDFTLGGEIVHNPIMMTGAFEGGGYYSSLDDYISGDLSYNAYYCFDRGSNIYFSVISADDSIYTFLGFNIVGEKIFTIRVDVNESDRITINYEYTRYLEDQDIKVYSINYKDDTYYIKTITYDKDINNKYKSFIMSKDEYLEYKYMEDYSKFDGFYPYLNTKGEIVAYINQKSDTINLYDKNKKFLTSVNFDVLGGGDDYDLVYSESYIYIVYHKEYYDSMLNKGSDDQYKTYGYKISLKNGKISKLKNLNIYIEDVYTNFGYNETLEIEYLKSSYIVYRDLNKKMEAEGSYKISKVGNGFKLSKPYLFDDLIDTELILVGDTILSYNSEVAYKITKDGRELLNHVSKIDTVTKDKVIYYDKNDFMHIVSYEELFRNEINSDYHYYISEDKYNDEYLIFDEDEDEIIEIHHGEFLNDYFDYALMGLFVNKNSICAFNRPEITVKGDIESLNIVKEIGTRYLIKVESSNDLEYFTEYFILELTFTF